MKVYTVVAVWGNTKHNHAGMYYLACKLKEAIGKKMIVVPTPTKGSRFLFPIYRAYNYLIGLWLTLRVNKHDKVFLMEYMLSETEQSDIARILHSKCEVSGIAHLVPNRLDKEYTTPQLLKRANYLDKLYVLGSSLKQYFVRKGVSSDKVITTYHYVDTSYYKPLDSHGENHPVTAICIGNMERDYDTLLRIVEGCPTVHFVICKGNAQFPDRFNELPNVTLYGFMPEDKLLELMQNSSLSLNVMKDTIGSNVITTSLACGLPVIASKVGSIADYVSDGVDGFLFNSTEQCIAAINRLSSDPASLNTMHANALIKAESISLQKFIQWFNQEFYSNQK